MTANATTQIDGVPGPVAPLYRRPLSALSAVRNTLAFIRTPLQFLEDSARRGDSVPLEFGRASGTLLLNHPDDIEHVLVKHRIFPKRHILVPEMRRFIGDGLAISEGELWRRQRRLIQQAFTRDHIASYTDGIGACTGEALDRWRVGHAIDLYAELVRIVLTGTARSFFSIAMDDDANDISAAVTVVMGHFAHPVFAFLPWVNKLPLPHTHRVQAAKERIDSVVANLIATRQSGRASAPARPDLLGALLAGRDEDGAPMPIRQVHDEVVTFYIAGYEPMAVALAWTFYLLGRHRDAMSRATEEARRALGGRPATFADVSSFPFISQVVNESVRLFPPAWAVSREAEEPCSFGGRALRKGGQMIMSPWVIHRDPRWFAEPLEFRPERWTPGFAKELPRCAYIPYGFGPRICIGASLAAAQLPAVVATILSRARLTPIAGRQPTPLPSINLRPRGGLWMQVEELSRDN